MILAINYNPCYLTHPDTAQIGEENIFQLSRSLRSAESIMLIQKQRDLADKAGVYIHEQV